MIVIILAGGFARRLLPLTLDTPKCLLPVRGKPVIDYVLDWISSSGQVMSRIVLLTNSRFESRFRSWARGKQPENIEVMSDGSSNENEKPGAVGALAAIASKIDQDFLVIAGDCIYPDGIGTLLDYFHRERSPIIGLYRAKSADQVIRGSSVQIGKDNVIIDFVEKPKNPKTDLVGAVVYAFPRKMADRLIEYCGLQLPRDQPGSFIQWLCGRETVYGHMLAGVVSDIGTVEAYEDANRVLNQTGA